MIELHPMLAISLEDICWIAFVGYMVYSSVFASKKKQPEGEEPVWEEEGQSPSAPGQGPQPVAQVTGKTPDLEQELKRLFGVKVAEPEPEPPLYVEEPVPEPEPVSRIDLSPKLEEVPEPLPYLSATQETYTQAGQLHERVTERMEDVDEQVRGHSVGLGTREDLTPQDIADAVAMVRRPDTARQAIIASVILAPPKALEG